MEAHANTLRTHAHLFPKPMSRCHLAVLNAILYVAEQGCKWRGLPASGMAQNTRMNRWAKAGVHWTECLRIATS